jgi:hypothetical protein
MINLKRFGKGIDHDQGGRSLGPDSKLVPLEYEASTEYLVNMDDRGSRVRFPTGAGNFSLNHRVQNGSGAHPASYPVGTRGSFPGGKAAGA